MLQKQGDNRTLSFEKMALAAHNGVQGDMSCRQPLLLMAHPEKFRMPRVKNVLQGLEFDMYSTSLPCTSQTYRHWRKTFRLMVKNNPFHSLEAPGSSKLNLH